MVSVLMCTWLPRNSGLDAPAVGQMVVAVISPSCSTGRWPHTGILQACTAIVVLLSNDARQSRQRDVLMRTRDSRPPPAALRCRKCGAPARLLQPLGAPAELTLSCEGPR
jgi:hypothetical protein